MTPESNPTAPAKTAPARTKLRSSSPARLLAAAACALLLALAIAPHAVAQTPTMLVLRAVPAKLKKGETTSALPPLTKADIGDIKIGGKVAPVTDFVPLLKGPHVLQLFVLLDSMQMIGGNGQFDSIKKFMNEMPSNVEIAVGWMLQGRVVVVQDFTTDRTLTAKVLIQKSREEAASPKNDNGNPYQCLRSLAAKWPSPDPAKLRAVLVFTDGIIRNNNQAVSGDQLNPDVDGASQSLQRSGIVPYPFFWLDYPPVDPNRNNGGQLDGQTNFSQLTADTGGEGLWEGQFAPGTFDPLLDKLYSTLQSEAVVTVTAPYPAGKYQRLDVKSNRDDIKISGPDNVEVGNVIAGAKK